MNGRYEVRVGFFTLFALILLLYGWAWLKSFSPLDPPIIFWARFHDVAGLSNNATVNIQGVRSGIVDTISFKLPEGLREEPEKPEGAKLPKVYLRIRLGQQKMPIPKTAAVTIQTLGLVGAKYVEITLPEDPYLPKTPDQLIDPNVVVTGQDPVRLEMAINNIAKKVNRVADAISSDEAADSVKNLAQVSAKLNRTMDKIPGVADSIKRASDNIAETSTRFTRTAERTTIVAESADKFFKEGGSTMISIHTLSENIGGTNTRLRKILENPALTGDIKETFASYQKTAASLSAALSEISSTVKDKEVRTDIITILGKIQTSAENIRASLETVNKLAADNELRSDLKVTVRDAKEALNKAHELLADPTFGADVKGTLSRVQNAACRVDEAAQRLNKMLSKPAPLLQMMFLRPGKLDQPSKCDPQAAPSIPPNSPGAPAPSTPLK